MLMLSPGNRDTDAMLSQILADLTAALGLIAGHAVGTPFGTPTPGTLDRALRHQGLEDRGLVLLAWRQHQRDQVASTLCAEMDFCAKAALAATQRFGSGVTAGGPCGVRMRPDDGAIDKVEAPVEVPARIRLLLHGGKQAVPEAGFAPPIKTARDRLPGAIALGQITPRDAGSQEPEDAIEHAAVVPGGTTGGRFLGRKERTELLPLLVSEFMSAYVHT